MSTIAVSEKIISFVSELDKPKNDFQKSAVEQLMELDFPTTKNEYWKYTRVTKITKSKFKSPTSVPQTNLESIVQNVVSSKNYLIIENGIMRNDLSQFNTTDFKIDVIKAKDVDINNLSFTRPNDIFTMLNTAYFEELISITALAKNKTEEVLQLIFIGTGDGIIANPRIVIKAENYSETKVYSSFISVGKNNFTNVVSHFNVDDSAKLTYDKIQNEGNENYHISTEEISQEKNSYFKINTAALSSAIVRNNINIAVKGENCESHMNGLIITKENQLIDNHTFVDHRVPNCFSNENYKYVLDGKSTGVFNGRVIVQKDAQKINAYQKNSNILLSDFAQINSKPELEIYADDVKCSHGSTTGQLDDNALFYLQARGISKTKAKKLLVSAFIDEVIAEFGDETTQAKINSILVDQHGWE